MNDQEFAELLDKAKAGDMVSQFEIGMRYHKGIDISINDNEAFKWYKLSAEQGYAPAQNSVGFAYYYGRGIEQNSMEGLKWYKLSADQGYAIALYWLGSRDVDIRFYDSEVCDNYEERISRGVHLLTLSAEQGFWLAYKTLADMYGVGSGVDYDPVKALDYYRLALGNANYSFRPADVNERGLIKWYIKYYSDVIEEMNAVAYAIAERGKKEAPKAERTEVFVSYSRRDKRFVDDLQPYFKMLDNTANIRPWVDTEALPPGSIWRDEIEAALANAKIAILLISKHFFASDFVWRKELPTILDKAKENGTTILWVLARTCPYEDEDLKIEKYTAITDPKKPLASLSVDKREVVYTKLYNKIKELLA